MEQESKQDDWTTPTTGAIAHAIENSYPHQPSGEALVVSIYGEWGIGKTRQLKELESYFEHKNPNSSTKRTYPLPRETWVPKIWNIQERLFGRSTWIKSYISPEEAANKVYIPIFFSPWRYEKESHLIVPLLITLERQTKSWYSKNQGNVSASLSSNLKAIATIFSGFAIAITDSLGGQIGPLVTSVWISVKGIFSKLVGRKSAEKEKLESLYYDAFSQIEGLAHYKSIRFVVLIDDLDRCLPEKSVEMLESIKLFLDLKHNFSFVLAVDEEVVERGINYRYRNYYRGLASDSKNLENISGQPNPLTHGLPITGNEYLEKIVHLPVFISRWSEDRAKDFLIKNHNEIFSTNWSNSQYADIVLQGSIPSVKPKENQENEFQLNKDLLTLFIRAIPLVPRKLIRAAEGTQLRYMQLLSTLKIHSIRYQIDIVTVARLTIIQQLYPEIYRLIRNGSKYYEWLFQTTKNQSSDNRYCYPFSKRTVSIPSEEEGGPPKTKEIDLVDQNNLRLFKNALTDAANNRYQKDPLAVVNDGRMKSSFTSGFMEDLERFYLNGEPPKISDTPFETNEPVEQPELRVSISEAATTLLLLNAASRREFMIGNDMRGKMISEDLLQKILDGTTLTHQSDRDWLNDMSDITSTKQLKHLYSETDLIENLQDQTAYSEEIW
ncbi:MAG: P-loop NTPase fold protein [Pseudomonadota bacterium]